MVEPVLVIGWTVDFLNRSAINMLPMNYPGFTVPADAIKGTYAESPAAPDGKSYRYAQFAVEVEADGGKTRIAAALLKRMFEANWTTRALFVVDRSALATQAEEELVEHLRHLPCYRVPRSGRRFQDEKRVTIVTLQTLVNEYEKYSSGYFDTIVIDECHRSIYGQWRRALDHFDDIKISLTATPCVMRDAPDVERRRSGRHP